jgi:hypothetical protein
MKEAQTFLISLLVFVLLGSGSAPAQERLRASWSGASKAAPAAFVDQSFVKELEASGFIAALYRR